MFCGCAVVDSTAAEPNRFVCPVCTGMPGMLPVINKRAVELGILVGLALNCEIAPVNVFARKSYFYPDLPKGYQISQYDLPLAVNGHLDIDTGSESKTVRIRRVHLEEDTGKLIHAQNASASLVDLNRAGVPLLEIVSEPDMRSVEEVRAYATQLHAILRYLGVNSGDMEKGVIRFEANVSVRAAGTDVFNTRTEIKNLNSFRALARSIEYEIARQSQIYASDGSVEQQTLGWNEAKGETVSQRSKEFAEDYRYFPEPDLPPLQIERDWVEKIRAALPELPAVRKQRLLAAGLSDYDAGVLVAEPAVAAFFDQAVQAGANAEPNVEPKSIANWLTSQLFGLINDAEIDFESVPVTPSALVELIRIVEGGQLNATSGRDVLRAMVGSGATPADIIKAHGLEQVSDEAPIAAAVQQVLADNPEQVEQYLAGKDTLSNWFFGQVMRSMRGQSNPQVVRRLLEEALQQLSS